MQAHLALCGVLLAASVAVAVPLRDTHPQGTSADLVAAGFVALAIEQFEKAGRGFTTATSQEDRPGGDRRVLVQALIGQAELMVQRSQFRDAALTIRRAQGLSEDFYGGRSVEHAHALLVRGEIDHYISPTREWQLHCDRAIQFFNQLARPPAQLVSRALACRAGVRAVFGDYVGAEQDLQRASNLLRPIARQHPSLQATILLQTAMLQFRGSPNNERGRRTLRHARRACQSGIGPNSRCEMQVTLLMGSMQGVRRRADEMIETAHAGLALSRRTLGAEHLIVAHFNHMLLSAYTLQERYEEFLDLSQEVERQYGALLPSGSLPIVAVWEQRAYVLARLGRLSEAISLTESALSAVEVTHGPGSRPTLSTLISYHTLLSAVGRTDEARLVQVRIERILTRQPQ